MAKAIKKRVKLHHRVRIKAKQVMETPLGIKAITIISYIAAAVFILIGIGLFIGGIILQQESEIVNTFLQVLITSPNSQLANISPIAKTAISSVLTYSGPVLIALGLVFFFVGLFRLFVGLSLLHGKAWSRIVVVCFCIIWIGFGFYNIARGEIVINAITIIFNLIVLYYLIFSKEAHNFFHHIPNHHIHGPNIASSSHADNSQKKLTHFISK